MAADLSFLQPNLTQPPDTGPSSLVPDPQDVPVVVDPYQDEAGIRQFFLEFHDECFDQRWIYERVWWRSILYAAGRHWIYYNTSSGQWMDKRMAKWVPRPVTNKIGEVVETIHSVFQSVPLDVDVRPDGTDPKDIATAETANQLAPAIVAEHDMADNVITSDLWLILTGNVIWQVWWNRSGDNGIVQTPMEQCALCGNVFGPDEIVSQEHRCPKCGCPQFTDAIDPTTGQPLQLQMPVGAGATDVCSPFEIGIPGGYSKFSELPGLIRRRWRTKRYYQRTLDPEVFAKLVFSRDTQDQGIRLLRALQQQGDLSASQNAIIGAQDEKGEGLIEYEMWYKPCREYPRGLVARFAGEGDAAVLLKQPGESLPGPIPVTTQRGEPLWPFVHHGYNRVPGRVWARGPIEPIIQLNDQVNQIDSLTQLIVQRVANPIWLEPRGAEVKKFTGEPGLVVKYNPLVAGGNAKPERMEGAQVPASLIQLRMQKLSDIETLSGTYDVMKGSKPPNVQAFSALQLLVERSQSRFGTPLKARGTAFAKWYQIALEFERQFGPQERTWAVLGPNKSWTYQHFMSANLQGSVRVLVEDGSQTPKTSLGKRAAIEQLRQMNAIDVSNPDTQYRILQIFGQTDLYPGLNAHVRTALQEQDAFEAWAQRVQLTQQPGLVDPATGQAAQPQVDPMTGQELPPMGVAGFVPGLSEQPPGQREIWHDDLVHLAEHTKWANSDKVRQVLSDTTKPWLKDYVTWFLQVHLIQIQMAQVAQAQAEAGPQPGGGGRAMERSNNESGQPGDVPRGTGTDQQGQGPQ